MLARNFKRLGLIGAISISLAACGGNSGSSTNIGSDEPTILTGYFTGGPVEGLTYATETQSGTTDINGAFTYLEGETITFSIGDTVLGEESAAKESMTAFDLVEGATIPTTTTDLRRLVRTSIRTKYDAFSKAHNILAFLQALDSDNNLDNGISIDAGIATLLTGAQINFDVGYTSFGGDGSTNEVRILLYKALNAGFIDRAYLPKDGKALDYFYADQEITTYFNVASTRSTDALGNITVQSFTYDELGQRLSTQINIDNDDSIEGIFSYTYNDDGDYLSRSLDLDGDSLFDSITSFTYDTNGNTLIETVDEDGDGLIDQVINSYTYDQLGNIISESEYDNGSIKLTLRTFDENGNNLSESVDQTSDGTFDGRYTRTYNASNNLLSEAVDSDGNDQADNVEFYTYDDNNILTLVEYDTDADGQIDAQESITYDANNNVTRKLYEQFSPTIEEYELRFTYDANGNQLSEEYLQNQTTTSRTNRTFNAFDQELSYMFDSNGDGSANHTIIRTYDEQGNLLTEENDHFSSGSRSDTTTWTYDSNGNMLSRKDDYSSDGSLNMSVTYTYDEFGNQLSTSVDSNGDEIIESIDTTTYLDQSVTFKAAMDVLDG